MVPCFGTNSTERAPYLHHKQASEFLDGSGASKHLGLNATEDDILEAKEFASTLSLERTREVLPANRT